MALETIVLNTDAFLSTGKDDCVNDLKSILKQKYDGFAKEKKTNAKNILPELIVDGFETEQIWQQIELANESLLTNCLMKTSDLCRKNANLVFKNIEKLEEFKQLHQESKQEVNEEKNGHSEEAEEYEQIGNGVTDSEDDDDEENDENMNEKKAEIEGEEDDDQIEIKSNKLNGKHKEAENEDLEGDEEESDESDEDDFGDKLSKEASKLKNSHLQNKQYTKKSEVDDDFFNLNEMENFLNKEETEKKPKNKNIFNEEDDDDEVDSDEESIDYFKGSDDEEDEEGMDGLKDDEQEDRLKNPKYADFFEPDEEEEERPSKKRKTLELELDSEASEIEDDEEEEFKSNMEKREERIKKRIKALEEEALAEKPWQLKGEVTSENRPENSLLEKVLEFDLTTRPAPVITEEVNVKLEDIIRRRIKDKVFDSVERKEKPVETPLEYKKKLVLDSEKSKESLAQIYEKEYLAQKEALDPSIVDKPEEEQPAHKEIRIMMTSLFQKLDALSNFHYTPRAAAPELKIVSNLPAITMEEVAPVTSTEASALAPEEIMPKKVKGDLIGESERTKTDKKRERRKKKIKQKVHAGIKKQKEEKIKEKNEKFREKIAKKHEENLTNNKNSNSKRKRK